MACKKRVETSFQSVKVAINFWPARNANLGRSKRITYKASCSQFANLGSTNETKKKRKKKKHTHKRKRAKAQQLPRLEPALLTTKKKKNEKENTLKPVFWKIYWKKKRKKAAPRTQRIEVEMKCGSLFVSVWECACVSVCVCVHVSLGQKTLCMLKAEAAAVLKRSSCCGCRCRCADADTFRAQLPRVRQRQL